MAAMTSQRAKDLWAELHEVATNEVAWEIIERHLDEHAQNEIAWWVLNRAEEQRHGAIQPGTRTWNGLPIPDGATHVSVNGHVIEVTGSVAQADGEDTFNERAWQADREE